MDVAIASKTESDVMLINYSWLYQYTKEANGFYDLYALKDYVDLTNFDENDLQFGKINDRLYAIPIAYNSQTMYYNETLYKSYGLDVPTTWDDYFEAAKVMRDDGIYPLGMVKKQAFFLMIAYFEQSTGEEFMDSNGNLCVDESDIEYMIEFYKKMIDEKVLMPLSDFERPCFLEQKVAGTMAWVSDASNYCDSLSEEGYSVVVGDYPLLPRATRLGWYIKPATMYAISYNTRNPKEAARLLDFLVNDENMATLQGLDKGVPISKSAYKALEENDMLTGYQYEADRKMNDNIDQMEIMNPYIEDVEFIEIFREESDKYVYDKASLKEAANNIYTNMNKRLVEIKKGE